MQINSLASPVDGKTQAHECRVNQANRLTTAQVASFATSTVIFMKDFQYPAHLEQKRAVLLESATA